LNCKKSLGLIVTTQPKLKNIMASVIENPLMRLFRTTMQEQNREPTKKEAEAFIKLHKNYPIVYRIAIFESKRHSISHTDMYFTKLDNVKWALIRSREQCINAEPIKIFVEESPEEYWGAWGNDAHHQ